MMALLNAKLQDLCKEFGLHLRVGEAKSEEREKEKETKVKGGEGG